MRCVYIYHLQMVRKDERILLDMRRTGVDYRGRMRVDANFSFLVFHFFLFLFFFFLCVVDYSA